MLPTVDSVTQLHRIDRSSEWPTEINSVSTLLDVPIPIKILDSSCSSLSQRASRLLSELSELFLHSSNRFGHGNSSPEMLEMLDLILSTVCMLRSIAGDDLRTTTPFWSLLIRSLAYVCHDKSYIIEDAPFVCVRLSRTHAIRPDGHASLLISHLAEELELPEHDMQDILPSGHTDAYSEGSYDEGDEPSIFDSDSNIGSSYHSEISTDLTSVPSCHIPLDAHVLAYWQRRDAAALPFLCVTDKENILPLIESTLYQRYTWGIDAPVVGIVISKTGCIVRVVFGWIGASVKPHALPIIHVANSDKESSDSSLGIYDLTDPASALQLAQFILGLRTHVKKIVEQCPRSTFRPFSWRSGCIDGQHLNGERWETRIHSWLSDIPQPRENRMLATHPMSSLLSLNHEMSRSRSTTSSNHQHSSQGTRSTSLSRSEGKPPPAQRGRTVDRSGGKRRSTSCSALGRKAVEGIAPTNKLSWGSYSHDRKVISLAAIDLRPSHSNDTVATDEINRMKAVYDQLTGYQAPPWESIGDMPTVDRRMNVIRDHFFKQMKECPRDTTLCTEHTITIADSFSSLCWASVGGFSKMVAQQETNEAEARHDWDFLMYLMYLSQSDINPSRPLLERTISLSQNIVVDSFNEPDFAQSFMTCARESVDLNERAVESAKQEFTNMSEVFLQANEAYNVSIKHAKAVDNLFKSKTVEIDIRNRADIEPKTAVCDIILPFPLDALQIVSEPLIKIAKPKPDDGDAANGSERGSRRSSVSGATKSTTSRSLANILEARSSSEEREELMTTLTASVAQNGHALPEEIGPEKFQSSDLQDPFSVNCSETKNAGPLPPATAKMVQSLVGLLLLVVLVGEYKKYSDRGFMKPLVQTRIYVEASCRHLASLGITDHPVFGLATNGCEGAVLMGWYSQAKDVVYLMERNIRTFNISSPIQVYHFATFVLRLRDYSQSVLKTKALQALGNAATFEQKPWTKQAQNDRLGLDAATPA